MFSRRTICVVCGSAAWLVLACGGGDHTDLLSAQSGGSGGAPTGVGSGGVPVGTTSTTSASTAGSSVTSGGAGSGVATTGSAGTAGGGQGGAATGAGGGVATGGGNMGGSAATGGSGAGMGGSGGGTGGTAGGAGMGGAGGGGVGASCLTSDTCDKGFYCKKAGCLAADVLGNCTSQPTECDSSESPICGCDGFTYLNSCLAELNGQNVGPRGACVDNAVICTPGSDSCKARPNGFCGVLLTSQSACFSLSLTGKCWVVPEECQAFNTHYDSCDGQGTCIHTCDAIKDGKPYVLVPDTRCN